MNKCKNQNGKWKIFGHSQTEAFTLIEMIVSLAIFSVVAVVALGAMAKIVSANRKAQSLLSAMTNINFALESMSRDMRVGSDFNCASGNSATPVTRGVACASSAPERNDVNGTVISFKSSKTNDAGTCNLTYAYIFKYNSAGTSWDIEKAQQSHSVVDPCSATTGLDAGSFSSIIDPDVIITGYYVSVTSDSHPLAVFRISGYVGAREEERTYFDVQTAVSARIANDI